MLTVIIPTYNEASNISTLLDALKFSLKDIDNEIIVVDDDSPDGTGDVVKEHHPHVTLVVRKTKRGLFSAVVDGIRRSGSDAVCVLDADLSHPPEKIRELYKEYSAGHDLVIGSRFIAGGKITDWPLARRLISGCAMILIRPLVPVSDPMSGFFLFDRRRIGLNMMSCLGYKVLLEFLVKGRFRNIKEVPIVFENRYKGTSKVDAGVIVDYLKQVVHLYSFSVRVALQKLFKPTNAKSP